MRKFHLFMLSAATIVIGLSGCGPEKGGKNLLNEINTEMRSWHLTSNAKKAYPNLNEVEAKQRYVRKMMADYLRNEPSAEKRQLVSAMVYLGYAQLNTRARVEYCGNMNVDINGFSRVFSSRHTDQDRAVDLILAKHDITRDWVWNKNKRASMTNVKNDLMRAGKLHGSRAMCSDINKYPDKYAIQLNFAKTLPNVARQLKEAEKSSVVKQASVEVPQLRR